MSLLQSILMESKENFLDKLDKEQKDFMVLHMEELMLGDENLAPSKAAEIVLEKLPEFKAANSNLRRIMANQLASFFVRHQAKVNVPK